jgi:TRAP-type mannitol/chloroaromatic compound transport system substrate-binding protein
VTVRKTPQDILSAQLDAWSEMITTLEQDPFIKKVLDSQRDWVKRTVFYELMDKPDYTLAYEHFFPGELKL